jgi:hypothetical protein
MPPQLNNPRGRHKLPLKLISADLPAFNHNTSMQRSMPVIGMQQSPTVDSKKLIPELV